MTVLDKNECTNGEWNYLMLVQAVNTLRGSQGFYSRLGNDMDTWDNETIANAKESLNYIPKFNDTLDVVMFLEQ